MYIDNIKVEVLDKADVERRLNGIEIKAEPDKNIYYIDDEFDPSGLKVNAVYNDGSSQELADGTYTLSGFEATEMCIRDRVFSRTSISTEKGWPILPW